MRLFAFIITSMLVAACSQESIGDSAPIEPASWTEPAPELAGFPPQINRTHMAQCLGELDAEFKDGARAECERRLKDPIGWEIDKST